MKILKYTLFVGVALSSFLMPSAQKTQHVILISIDGLRPAFYMDASWPAPVLQQLKREGVYAQQVKGVFPTVTYPSHTSIISGVTPGKHGIYYNAPIDAVKGRWYWNWSAIKTPTLWDAVKKKGMTSGAVMWPVTVGAPIDFNFPVKRADDDSKEDQLSVTRPLVTPKNLLVEIARTGKWEIKPDDFKGDQIDRTIGKMAIEIFKNHQPNLLAVHFIHADHAQHEHGLNHPQVREAVAIIDSMIAQLLDAVKEAGKLNQTTVIITGDHGFVDVNQVFSPNVLLAKAGLMEDNNEQARFHAVGGSTFLYLKNPKDEKLLARIVSLLNGLPASDRALFKMVDRNQLKATNGIPGVGLALAMAEGVVANNRKRGALVTKENKTWGAHGFYPDFDAIATGFVAVGPELKKAARIDSMSLLDITPIVSQLLDLPKLPGQGRVISGVFVK